jgi:general secretion pathway protein N
MVERQMMLTRILFGGTAAAMVTIAGAGGFARATDNPRGLDPGEDVIDQPLTISPRVTPMPPLYSNSDGGLNNSAVTGNPLWGITIETLHTTRERPIFSPSRRPPMPAAIAAPPPPPLSPPPAPDEPAFDLLGTVAGSGVGYAVFLDKTTQEIVRLKTGEGQDGWILQSVKDREAVLTNDNRTAVMRLPSPTGEQQ